MPKGVRDDLTGRTFGDWLALHQLPNAASGQIRYQCRCACGTEVPVQAGNLRNGTSKRCRSCGNSRKYNKRWKKDS